MEAGDNFCSGLYVFLNFLKLTMRAPIKQAEYNPFSGQLWKVIEVWYSRSGQKQFLQTVGGEGG